MEKLILFALLICSFTVTRASEVENKVQAGRQKAAELIARDNKGETLEDIAEREKKKEQQKSRNITPRKTSNTNVSPQPSRSSRLELWRTRRKQSQNKQ